MEGNTVWKQPLGVRCCKVKKQEESVCSVLSVDPRLRSSPCRVSRARCAQLGRTLAGREGRWSGRVLSAGFCGCFTPVTSGLCAPRTVVTDTVLGIFWP